MHASDQPRKPSNDIAVLGSPFPAWSILAIIYTRLSHITATSESCSKAVRDVEGGFGVQILIAVARLGRSSRITEASEFWHRQSTAAGQRRCESL